MIIKRGIGDGEEAIMQVVGQPCRQNRIVPIAYIDSIQNRGLHFCNPRFFFEPYPLSAIYQKIIIDNKLKIGMR